MGGNPGLQEKVEKKLEPSPSRIDRSPRANRLSQNVDLSSPLHQGMQTHF